MDLRHLAMIMLQALLVMGVRASEIRTYPLDERTVYTVRLSREEPTTCVFPAPLKAVVGANVSVSVKDEPGILLSHETGTEYFHLRLLQAEAKGALNVVVRGKVYALALVPAVEPDRAVIFLDEPVTGGAVRPSGGLPSLVERARQLGRESAGDEMVSQLQVTRPGSITAYRDFVATVETVVRFAAEDTLVFRIRLENPGEKPVPYDPAALAIRLGRELFPAAYAEGSGAVPPHGDAIVWVALNGAPGGGRANLSPQGNFGVIVPQP